jgi:hypothetical protein
VNERARDKILLKDRGHLIPGTGRRRDIQNLLVGFVIPRINGVKIQMQNSKSQLKIQI